MKRKPNPSHRWASGHGRHCDQGMRQIRPALVDDGFGKSGSSKRAVIEFLNVKPGEHHHLRQREWRKLKAMIRIDRLSTAQGSRGVAPSHAVRHRYNYLLHCLAVVFAECRKKRYRCLNMLKDIAKKGDIP